MNYTDNQVSVAIDDRADQGSTPYVVVVSTVAALGGLLFGFDIGVIAGAIPFITEHFGLNAHQEGFAVSNIILGCVIGSGLSGHLSDRFGRKKVLLVAALFFTVSACLSAFPRTFAELIIARFIGGIAIGASMISALYIAEIAPARIRGFLVSLNQFAIVIGILMTYIINLFLVNIGENNWRWMFASEMIPALLFFIGLFFVPESPRWLAKQGAIDRARAILARIGGILHARDELREIEQSLEEEEGTFRELFQPGLRTALFIGVVISIFAQIVGIGSVIYYAPMIFMMAGFETASSALFATVLVGIVNFLATIVSLVAIDRLGRKPLLYIGLVGMCLSMTVTGMFFHSDFLGGKIVIISILTFVWFYAMSLGPVAWVIVAEIFPTKVRGRAMAIAMMVLWISDFSVSQTFPWLMETIEAKTFFIYAAISVFGFFFVLFKVKETKGKTLEEIEKMWK